ncbi:MULTISPECIES: hypothetical protein [unclassified Psychrobacillus]|uniref:hypothetical protein n=1 Tax=unclassified Psychrobacillus TaxID=2636677 RepID=UPI0030F853CE
MEFTDLTEKQCIGCGNFYSIPTEVAMISLYCCSTCKENHSIFMAEDTNFSFDKSLNVGEHK